MKNILFLLLATGFANLSRSQSIDTVQKADTVQTFDYGKMPPVYFLVRSRVSMRGYVCWVDSAS